MKIPFQTPARKGMVAAVAVVFAVLYLGQATRFFLASWLSNREVLKSGGSSGRVLKRLEWAARLDPGNADYPNYLGGYHRLVALDPREALRYYKIAVQLNPHSADYWFDLASAYQVLEDTPAQTQALEHAIEADPMKPNVAWEAANNYLVQGQKEKAQHEFSVVMANTSDPSVVYQAIQYCWQRINPDVDVLLRDVVPHNAEAYVAFLTLLEHNVAVQSDTLSSPTDDTDVASLTEQIRNEIAGSFKVWDALMQTRQPFEVRHVYDYFQFLILHKQVDEAVLVWQEAVNRFGLTAYLPSSSNLVVNGSFSLDIRNGGFDWHYEKQRGVQLTLDPGDFHSGHRSLRIDFDGPRISDAGIYEFIAVQPSTTYDFTGYYKIASELEGAGAPHFTVQDMYSKVIYFDSDELKEQGYWKSVNGEFTTGPDCKLVVLHVRRLPEGSPIRGKLWVDDFHLAPKKPS